MNAPSQPAPRPPGPPRRVVVARDVGLLRISRYNRWLIAAAIGLSGFFSAVVALAKPGATQKSKAAVASTPAAGSSDSGSGPSADPNAPSGDPSASGGLQPPVQAPAPTPLPPMVSSGGS